MLLDEATNNQHCCYVNLVIMWVLSLCEFGCYVSFVVVWVLSLCEFWYAARAPFVLLLCVLPKFVFLCRSAPPVHRLTDPSVSESTLSFCELLPQLLHILCFCQPCVLHGCIPMQFLHLQCIDWLTHRSLSQHCRSVSFNPQLLISCACLSSCHRRELCPRWCPS